MGTILFWIIIVNVLHHYISYAHMHLTALTIQTFPGHKKRVMYQKKEEFICLIRLSYIDKADERAVTHSLVITKNKEKEKENNNPIRK